MDTGEVQLMVVGQVVVANEEFWAQKDGTVFL
jgi:hypothetical protein